MNDQECMDIKPHQPRHWSFESSNDTNYQKQSKTSGFSDILRWMIGTWRRFAGQHHPTAAAAAQRLAEQLLHLRRLEEATKKGNSTVGERKVLKTSPNHQPSSNFLNPNISKPGKATHNTCQVPQRNRKTTSKKNKNTTRPPSSTFFLWFCLFNSYRFLHPPPQKKNLLLHQNPPTSPAPSRRAARNGTKDQAFNCGTAEVATMAQAQPAKAVFKDVFSFRFFRRSFFFFGGGVCWSPFCLDLFLWRMLLVVSVPFFWDLLVLFLFFRKRHFRKIGEAKDPTPPCGLDVGDEDVILGQVFVLLHQRIFGLFAVHLDEVNQHLEKHGKEWWLATYSGNMIRNRSNVVSRRTNLAQKVQANLKLP